MSILLEYVHYVLLVLMITGGPIAVIYGVIAITDLLLGSEV